MATSCENLELFVDGELSAEEAEAFRLHLPDCVKCQREMADLMQLKLLGQRYVERTETQEPAPLPVSPPATRWRRQTFMALTSLAAALLLGVTVRQLTTPSLDNAWLEERPERLLEARLSYRAADRHRALTAQQMGSEASDEPLPYKALDVLREEDPHGEAAVYLARRDAKRAEPVLRRLAESTTTQEKQASSPDITNDLAVVLMLKGQPEQALRMVESVLEKNANHPQALWNRGLLLRQLNLPHLAARSFTRVAALEEKEEPGWAREAREKAATLEGEARRRQEQWTATSTVGRQLLTTAPGPLDSFPVGFIQAPLTRAFFYDAVRAAPSRERVLALRPLARALDAEASGHGLEQYVLQVANADFSRRAPLARDYVALVNGSLPAKERERLLSELLKSKEDDILLGALAYAGATTRYLDVFEARATASGDAWLQLLAAQERAKADVEKGRWPRAVHTLQQALQSCPRRGLEYRCISLQIELSNLYIHLHQLDAARTHAEQGWTWARTYNEWTLERSLMWNLAQVARFAHHPALARAFYGELFERYQDQPDMVRRFHQSLAALAMDELLVDEARRELDAALATGLPLSLSGAFTLADIARQRSGPRDEEHLKAALAAPGRGQEPGERAVATHVLGRFYVERDPKQGITLLRRAIAEAGEPGLEEDVNARRARTSSYTSLLLEAGKRGAYTEALELFAEERGLELPERCLLAATVDSERTLLLVRGATGELTGHYDATRTERLPERLDGFVPEKLQSFLSACSQVEVLARPPLHGRAGLLPPELAWSYLTRTTPPPQPPRTGPARHLVVSDVALPSNNTTLPRLNSWTPSFGLDEVRIQLSGEQATPSRVLADMRNATEIDLVAHGVINENADTSYILLAEEKPDGPELSMSEVRSASLQGAPFVVLAACHGARTGNALHEPFSLPAAFIQAGARGVLAATVQIPDLEAQDFFNALRARIRSGTSPALALRDERIRWLRENRGKSWLDSVLLFE